MEGEDSESNMYYVLFAAVTFSAKHSFQAVLDQQRAEPAGHRKSNQTALLELLGKADSVFFGEGNNLLLFFLRP